MLEGSARAALRKPFVMSGNQEPLIFMRRAGYAGAGFAERYLAGHSEEAVKRMADSGITRFRMHFFKGFGLKHERPEIDMSVRMSELCHKHGIRVQLYTQWGTLQYETFKDEVPDVENWVQINYLGVPCIIIYGHHGFRWRLCTTRQPTGTTSKRWCVSVYPRCTRTPSASTMSAWPSSRRVATARSAARRLYCS